jgi:hypothetical protein
MYVHYYVPRLIPNSRYQILPNLYSVPPVPHYASLITVTYSCIYRTNVVYVIGLCLHWLRMSILAGRGFECLLKIITINHISASAS